MRSRPEGPGQKQGGWWGGLHQTPCPAQSSLQWPRLTFDLLSSWKHPVPSVGAVLPVQGCAPCQAEEGRRGQGPALQGMGCQVQSDHQASCGAAGFPSKPAQLALQGRAQQGERRLFLAHSMLARGTHPRPCAVGSQEGCSVPFTGAAPERHRGLWMTL